MAHLIYAGNIKLCLCFAFYLAWWVVGFNPWRPIRGIKSAWLLIPALVFGVLALCDIMRGTIFVGGPVPGLAIIACGVLSYLVLLAITGGMLQRPVTSELLIIVLWAVVAMLEVNTLAALDCVTAGLGMLLVVLSLAFTGVSLVCYQRFYGLEEKAAFVDGTIPLVLAGIMTAVIAYCAVI